jgi:hypothetical protein
MQEIGGKKRPIEGSGSDERLASIQERFRKASAARALRDWFMRRVSARELLLLLLLLLAFGYVAWRELNR